MKFKNPIYYVDKFNNLVKFAFKNNHIFLGIVLLMSALLSPVCFLMAYNNVPNENEKMAVAGIITELKCYPAGFKHSAFCRVKIDNYFFRNDFVDSFNNGENGLKRANLSDLLKIAYYEKKCVFIEYYNSTILKMEYCNGETIYLFRHLNTWILERKITAFLGILLLLIAIFTAIKLKNLNPMR
ncbi:MULTISPECIES: hypothetical protein [unclassified Campylobacter]|uniref:hypothetical protein n=1 Tax=unclassified Campylobacter TaxID=2593542 RepID=UPI0022EA04A6|nr:MULTISPECIES: hypothetical protein [unclassified Campylobacter]MDA3042913.1 hypothetical protein [Campylobacter sp. JMF_09 ED2]MDA3044252.1 hypothetical protein [Campylobacter sp. JMF_07 ED4]MDA3063601.1 hypothetical protein [Campylobacter sp. JMF_11 EL3]MDA3071227.1 hypothetical protein [Campylobacter sp. VBCF_03 NA9]MDA3074687.1 hypothetical protein [Campylobacter sp. JMF_05 ED3]